MGKSSRRVLWWKTSCDGIGIKRDERQRTPMIAALFSNPPVEMPDPHAQPRLDHSHRGFILVCGAFLGALFPQV